MNLNTKSTKKNKKIIIFTGDDMFYTPLLLEEVLKNKKSDIYHIYISTSFLSYKRLSKKFGFFIRNQYPFCISLKDWFNFFMMHLNKIFFSFINRNPKNIKEYLNRKGFNCSYIKEINSNSFYEKLRSQNPDLFFFACFDKIASEEFCKIPNLGTYNIHLGKLPGYKGGLSSFWVLRFQDKTAGASIHKVTKEIDSGELIAEITFNADLKSMHLLMLKTVKISSKLINNTINNIFQNKKIKINIKERSSNYFLFPSKKDFKEFYKKGCRLI